jgi:hypothetical protein
MATYPFVNFKMLPTGPISSTPTLIFGNDQHTCLLDGILLSNLTGNTIQVTLILVREIEIGAETEFILADQVTINANDRVDILQSTTLTLQPGDLLYAQSEFSGNVFNAFISYRELTELTAN